MSVGKAPDQRRVVSRHGRRSLPVLAGAATVALLVVLTVQVEHLPATLDVSEPLTAGYAKALVAAYGLAVLGLCAAAALLPDGRRWLPVATAMALGGLALVGTLFLGGQLWSCAWAVLTLCACWQVGRWVLGALRVPMLASAAPVALLMGMGVVGLVLLFAGRAGLLKWWLIAAPLLGLGLLGARGLLTELRGGARGGWDIVTSGRLSAAATAVTLLTVGFACIWTAAPELTYDALHYKAWLPSEWARNGEIEPLGEHPLLNFFGTAQLLAIPGHLAGADAVGRYLQWLAYGGLFASVWWAARRSAWAPIAAAAVVITPQIFWEATSAYDDLLLALAAVAMVIAVLRLVEQPPDSRLLAGTAVGLLAGCCFNFKTHLAPLAAGLVLGWLLTGGRYGLGKVLAAICAGGLVVAAPPLVLRWIDLGNPLLPSYNAIFKSQFVPPRNLSLGFPRLEGELPYGPLSIVWKAIADTSAIDSYAPVGALGLLVVAAVVALLTGWRSAGASKATVAIWTGLMVGALSWYLQFRNTRYALPVGTVSVLALAIAVTGVRVSRRAESVGIAGLALAAVLLWPSTISQFFYTPGRDLPWRVAFGLESAREWEREATPVRDILSAYDRIAPPGALAFGEPHQRAWLTGGRDLSTFWEADLRVRIPGPVPEALAEVRDRLWVKGYRYAIRYAGASTLDDKPGLAYLGAVIDEYGDPVWQSPVATIYKLTAP